MTRQHGVASRAQGRAVGVSRAVERRLVSEGALVPVLSGVLAAGGMPITFRTTAMAASLRSGVMAVSHGAAARLHGLAGFEAYAVVDVIGGRGARLRIEPPVMTHYSRGPLRGHVTRVGAIPVTSVALTLTLLAPTCDPGTTHGALCDALRRGVPAPAIRAVALAWRECGRSGPALVLALLDQLARRRPPSAPGPPEVWSP
jgi:hypothetical protein